MHALVPRPGDDLPAVRRLPGLRHRDPATRARSARGDGRVRTRRSLTVKIPAGVDTGTRIQLTGEGEVGPGGGPAGDLYVEIVERRTRSSRRQGDDLHCTVAGADDGRRAGHHRRPWRRSTARARSTLRARHAVRPDRDPAPTSASPTCAAAGRGDLHRARRGADADPARRRAGGAAARAGGAARRGRPGRRARSPASSRASSTGSATPSTSAEATMSAPVFVRADRRGCCVGRVSGRRAEGRHAATVRAAARR